MPHEKIHDRHNRSTLPGEDVQPPQPFLEIGWAAGPAPMFDVDGWVQVSANRDGGVDARIANPDDEAVAACTAELIKNHIHPAVSDADVARLAAALMPHMRYAFGEPVQQLAIQLDRSGCNRAISTLRRARDRAYGADA